MAVKKKKKGARSRTSVSIHRRARPAICPAVRKAGQVAAAAIKAHVASCAKCRERAYRQHVAGIMDNAIYDALEDRY